MNEFNENLNPTGEVPQTPQMPVMPQPPVENTETVEPQTTEAQQTVTENVQEEAQQNSEPAPQPQPEQNVQGQRPTPPPYRPYPPQGYGQPQGNPYVSGYAQPQQRPPYQQNQNPYSQGQNPYAQPQNPYGQPQDYYNMTYGVPKPEKQKMSGGLKALIIIIISILVACLAGFTLYLSFGLANNQQANQNNSAFDSFGNFEDFGGFGDFGGSFDYTQPTSPTFSQEQSSGETYEESDASKKIDADFKGVELKDKPKDKSNSKYNASYSFDKLQNSVVGVVCYYKQDEGTDNYQSQGTGIIVTSDGYIVTNSHVIGNSRKAYLIKVIMADKKEYKAGVVGYDSRSDVAVLKIDAKNLPVAEFGNSAQTEITEDVIAIGNPSGLEFQNSVTKGIVSALDRKVSDSNNVEFIQIDAAINPGNSGGPLCNMYGQVIGITTSKIASEVYEGMGFAIPSTTVKKLVDDIIRNSYVTNRVKVGITGLAVYEAQAGADGIQIVAITKGGPLDNTEAKIDDIITAVDGEKVTTFAEIFDILEKHKEGDKVKVTLYRPSTKKSFDVEIKLQIDKVEE